MIKTLRIATTALFMMSMFCLASCNRNQCGCSPCEVNCPPKCDPCQAPCAQPCASTCQPCNNAPCGPCRTPRCAPCAPAPQPCATAAPKCGTCNSNSCYPCDPSVFPCGANNANMSSGNSMPMSGGCAATTPCNNEGCYRGSTTSAMCDECLVDLCQSAPEFATVGAPFPITIVVTARKECAAVEINQKLPMDADFIRSEPSATPDAQGHVMWKIPHMKQGDSQQFVVWVKPRSEGCCLAEATICACPQLCTYTNCGQPVVCIKKCGPACACLYCPITYRIDVCNSGSAPAYDVVVQDTIPEGLSHASGYSCLSYNLGTLCPGDSRTIYVDLCATQPGTVTNNACVCYCGGPKCCAEATTIINKPCVSVTKTGPDWAYICKIVDYTITVTNPGDLVLTNVVVDDVTGAGTTVVEAPGAEICCNRATWCVDQLCPGETKTFKVSVRSQVAGCIPNKVNVTTQSDCGPCCQSAEAVTCWKGIPAVHMCMVDTCDPICIGETTMYRICVTNRGTADDTNIKLSVKFTNELQPQSLNGPVRGSINGQTVTFDPIDRLAPKQCVEYTITVKGVAVGNARADASLSTDARPEVDTDSEGTHVY